MAESLATKYRPKRFEEVVGQGSIIKILRKYVETGSFPNCLLFCGSSGCGKTTLARIFANEINGYVGNPIEIDAASNNGVDNVKTIIRQAQERSIDSKYKAYIIDECHALSNSAWQAFLKCIEEPPAYTLFIFCTTDPQKIPATILNRVQRYNITRLHTDQLRDRLKYICRQEGYTNFDEACDYISKISDGGARDAIATLEKCAGYSKDLCIENVLETLGNYSYRTFFRLVNGLIDGKEDVVLSVIDEFYRSGNDLKLCIDLFLSFCLDISKYSIFQSCTMLKIPSTMEGDLKSATNFDNAKDYYMYLVNRLLELKNMLKNDSNVLSTIEVMMLKIARMQ